MRKADLIALPSFYGYGRCVANDVADCESGMAAQYQPAPCGCGQRDVYTTIRHLINHYVLPERLQVAQLVTVAAHAICMGHRENNAGIAGLEVAVIRQDGSMVLLSPEQEKELQSISDTLHEDLQRLLTQPYSLSP